MALYQVYTHIPTSFFLLDEAIAESITFHLIRFHTATSHLGLHFHILRIHFISLTRPWFFVTADGL